MCENHLFRLKEKEKRCRGGDSRSKNDLKPPLFDKLIRKKIRENAKSLSLKN